jgi:hypothetical protein
MSNFLTRFVLLFCLVAVVWNCLSIWHDFHHPEIWEEYPWRDPRRYMPWLALTAGIWAWAIIHIWRAERKRRNN